MYAPNWKQFNETRDALTEQTSELGIPIPDALARPHGSTAEVQVLARRQLAGRVRTIAGHQ
jgi:hypothetical protein